MLGTRALQKEKTRQAIIQAALAHLSADQSFSMMSLREVAREAGIAPTSFYRHFDDMEALGLTLVDESGITLRELMRKARSRIEKKGSVIQTSVDTFMEFVETNPNIFRLLLRERTGISPAFRDAVAREIRHFKEELSDYLAQEADYSPLEAYTLAEGLVTLVFNAGADSLDLEASEREALKQRTIMQLRYLTLGAKMMHLENNTSVLN
ncbi:HTH-type transcriptional repressor FabR [Kangiella spongicola]|jgi:AcrR family transcriptional regulator|uniref:HTH-type transcriptional repressor FabR n=1 Tax=Kangiella spongicola TaxID=796379 RepID=A0A318D105_9GAMM|nr:HTH-type transcriptional repressor FabR [Kangiella spongicola]PXF62890.1 HTH-type transcriptional repressor FabR [Kangiella spongicola]